jgi:GNAT superfamily N-acetyltransferase
MGILKRGRGARRIGTYTGGLRAKLRSASEVAGCLGAWKFATRALPWSFSRDYSVFFQDLAWIAPFHAPSIPCDIRQAGSEDIPAIMALRKGYYSRAVLEKRFEDGHLAFLGWAGERLAYCQWALVGSFEVPYFHGRLVLAPGDAYTDEIYVHPRFRGAGIFSYGSGLVRTALREKGVRKLYSAVASWNEVPRKFMLNSGMTEIARLRCRNVPGFLKVRWSGRVDVHDDGSFMFHGSR